MFNTQTIYYVSLFCLCISYKIMISLMHISHNKFNMQQINNENHLKFIHS